MTTKTLDQAAGKVYISKPGVEELFLENAIEKRNQEKLQKEASEKLIEAEKAKQKELESKLSTLELIPIGPRILILPYPRNPYKKTVSKGGILIDYDGGFLNPDTGEQDKMNVGIGCAKVIEVGPDTRYAKPGDDIFYDTRTAVPIPFFGLGYQEIAEQNAFTIINEGLRERLKDYYDGK